MTPTRSSAAGVPMRSSRPRDAAASKRALLQAAQDLFGQSGFERTTIREIGDRAGVDAALIARYFGSKADLYVAAVVAERMDERRPAEYEGLGEMAEALITRSDRHGPGPILQALIRSDTSEEIRVAARARLARKLVEPLAATFADQGLDRPRLRAELVVAALIGVNLGRSQEWFDELQAVPSSEVIALVTETLGSVAVGDPGRPD